MSRGGILIIEDEMIVALALAKTLTDAGHTVHEIAISAHEAVNLAERFEPDLVIADIKLAARPDGIEAIAMINNRLGGRPVVFITGNTDPRTRQRAMRSDPLAYLEKPVTDERLLDTVRRAIGSPPGAI